MSGEGHASRKTRPAGDRAEGFVLQAVQAVQAAQAAIDLPHNRAVVDNPTVPHKRRLSLLEHLAHAALERAAESLLLVERLPAKTSQLP